MQGKKLVAGAAICAAVIITSVAGCSKSQEDASRQGSGGQQGSVAAPDSSAAINKFKEMLKANPNDSETMVNLGDAFFENKQFNESVFYYRKALELRPDDAELYNNLGLCLHYMGNSVEGLKYIDEGTRKNPKHQRIWLTKGFISAYGIGDYDAARKAWDKARALDPDSPIGKAASDFLAQLNKKAIGR